MLLKEIIKSWEYSDNPVLTGLFSIFRFGKRVVVFLSVPSIRWETLTAWTAGRQQFQRPTFTHADRYPAAFEKCREYFAGKPGVNILSFGCSTGEEVLSLGKYMPDANITGVEINKWCLKKCREKDPSGKYRFIHRKSSDFNQLQNLDAIFCMAVFQRTEHRLQPELTESVADFRFEHFDAEITLLDKKLKPGGLFFIDRVDYSFMETSAAAHYTPLQFEDNKILRRRPLFNKENQKVATSQFPHWVFVKTE